jgi:cysteinyl-tRNA synthetase
MTKKKEEFIPLKGNRVSMFVCGPTVYDDMHLGHARTYIAYDIIARYLRFKGYSLFFIMNITDVDDKIITRAKEESKEPLELAKEFEKRFYEDMKELGINSINLFVRASEHISEIIEQIKALLEKGYAYMTETGIYYDVTRFPDYGKLSHQKYEKLIVHRIEPDPTKRNPADFALWKKEKPGEPSWSSPWGKGRPGWHIEDTAMTTAYFGPTYDIHGGAIELVFPHHEAEIAQAEAATGVKPLVRYWVHTGLLLVEGQKMSKSLGNFITVRDALKKHSKDALRLFFASTLYRSPIDYSDYKLDVAERTIKSIKASIASFKALKEGEKGKELEEIARKLFERFIEAMDDDFNTPVALSHLHSLISEMNKFMEKNNEINNSSKRYVLNVVNKMLSIIGIEEEREFDEDLARNLISLIVELRAKFRKKKDWDTSDWIRSKLKDLGIELEDFRDKTRWRLVKGSKVIVGE